MRRFEIIADNEWHENGENIKLVSPFFCRKSSDLGSKKMKLEEFSDDMKCVSFF